MANAFEVSSMQASYDNYSGLIAPYATTELTGFSFLQNANDFITAVVALKAHVASRAAAVDAYLSTQ